MTTSPTNWPPMTALSAIIPQEEHDVVVQLNWTKVLICDHKIWGMQCSYGQCNRILTFVQIEYGKFINWCRVCGISKLLPRNQACCCATSRSAAAAVAVFTVRRTRGLLLAPPVADFLHKQTRNQRPVQINCRNWVNPALPASACNLHIFVWFPACKVATC